MDMDIDGLAAGDGLETCLACGKAVCGNGYCETCLQIHMDLQSRRRAAESDRDGGDGLFARQPRIRMAPTPLTWGERVWMALCRMPRWAWGPVLGFALVGLCTGVLFVIGLAR